VRRRVGVDLTNKTTRVGFGEKRYNINAMERKRTIQNRHGRGVPGDRHS